MSDRETGAWRLVPNEPTDAQLIAALEAGLARMKEYGVDGLSPFSDYPPVKGTIVAMYKAMLAALPTPPEASS